MDEWSNWPGAYPEGTKIAPQQAALATHTGGKRAYNAAAISRLTASLTTTARPPDTDIRFALRIVRARSRAEAQNNDHVRAFLRIIVNNVIGANGIHIRPQVTKGNGKPDDSANKAIKDAWWLWGRKGVCDFKGEQSWLGLQNAFLRNVAMDGEVFVRIWRGRSYNKWGLALELIDPETVPVEYNQELKTGYIRQGVEYDLNGRRVAYHIREYKPTSDSYDYAAQQYIRVPASDMIHGYMPEWIFQSRGVPWITTALLRLNMLQGYEEAELIAARVAATQMGFFSDASGSGYAGDGTDQNGNLLLDAEPGTFRNLPPGVELQKWDPQHPNVAFPMFLKSMLRAIASGLGTSYSSLSGDLENVNYSSIRQGALEERDVYRCFQQWVIEQFHERVYEEWIAMSYVAGAISVSASGGTKKPISRDLDSYSYASWQPRRWSWIDPQKEMGANQLAVSMGLRSRSSIIREMGEDPDEVWQEMAQENERMAELGIPVLLPAPPKSELIEDPDNEDVDDPNPAIAGQPDPNNPTTPQGKANGKQPSPQSKPAGGKQSGG